MLVWKLGDGTLVATHVVGLLNAFPLCLI